MAIVRHIGMSQTADVILYTWQWNIISGYFGCVYNSGDNGDDGDSDDGELVYFFAPNAYLRPMGPNRCVEVGEKPPATIVSVSTHLLL